MKRSHWNVAALNAAVAAIVLLGLLFTACGREKSVEENLAETGTRDVLEQAGEDEYEPPSDGELTPEQVEMYLAVQERAVKIREVTSQRLREQQAEAEAEKREVGLIEGLSAVGETMDFLTAELRAAKELGHNSVEYQWVQEQVMEAQVAKATRGIQHQAAEARQQFVQMMEQQLANTQDAEEKAVIEQQIAEYRQGLAENTAEEDLEPGLPHNIDLLERYQDRLDRVQQLNQEIYEQQREAAR